MSNIPTFATVPHLDMSLITQGRDPNAPLREAGLAFRQNGLAAAISAQWESIERRAEIARTTGERQFLFTSMVAGSDPFVHEARDIVMTRLKEEASALGVKLVSEYEKIWSNNSKYPYDPIVRGSFQNTFVECDVYYLDSDPDLAKLFKPAIPQGKMDELEWMRRIGTELPFATVDSNDPIVPRGFVGVHIMYVVEEGSSASSVGKIIGDLISDGKTVRVSDLEKSVSGDSWIPGCAHADFLVSVDTAVESRLLKVDPRPTTNLAQKSSAA